MRNNSDELSVQTKEERIRIEVPKSIQALAQVRENVATLVDNLAAKEKELKELAPVLVDEITDLKKKLAEARKFDREDSANLRGLFEHNYKFVDHPAVTFRHAPEGVFEEDYALFYAPLFCPEAIALKEKVFNKWLIANYNDNPLLHRHFSIKEGIKATIKTDLSSWLPLPPATTDPDNPPDLGVSVTEETEVDDIPF